MADPEVLQKLSAEQVKQFKMRRFRTRNAIVGVSLLAGVFGIYSYTMWAVKQESFLSEEFDQIPTKTGSNHKSN